LSIGIFLVGAVAYAFLPVAAPLPSPAQVDGRMGEALRH
jgi:hypothetical protein